jgi:hypothetical protein
VRSASNFSKSANMTQFFFFTKSKKVSKTQNFTLISNPLKKLLENAPKKVISKTSLVNMSKSENSACFRPVFANNFFGAFFQI